VYTTLDTRTQEELQQRMFEAAHHGYTRALEELLNGGVPVDKQHESVSVSMCMCVHSKNFAHFINLCNNVVVFQELQGYNSVADTGILALLLSVIFIVSLSFITC